jgi:hypothetical protein
MRPQNRSRLRCPFGAKELINAAVQMQVRLGRRHGHPTETIRADVRTAMNRALDLKENSPPRPPGDPRYDDAVTSFWLFRIILNNHNVDRRDQYVQERWHQMVMRELDAVLGQEDGASV